jgi:hypothetical protein
VGQEELHLPTPHHSISQLIYNDDIYVSLLLGCFIHVGQEQRERGSEGKREGQRYDR